MVVKFLSPIANASQFPVPVVSATPKFRLTGINLLHDSGLELKNATYTRNGRGAIGIAGEALKKPTKNVILIPSYHCPALVEPFIWLGYEIRFYSVQADLSIDIETLKAQLSAGDVTHCVVIRYFGFSQNVHDLIEFLANNQVEVIEDCAHALFAFLAHFTPQMMKDDRVSASICSINKILPTIDGGALYLKEQVALNLSQAEWSDEAKACAYLVGIPQALGKIKSAFKPNITVTNEEPDEPLAEPSNHLRYFQPVDRQSASYRHTHYILRKSDLDDVKFKRRKNFEYLLENINNPDVGTPLFSELNDDVPYVMPFLLKDDKHFFDIRSLGIQILRWEEIATSECKVSQQYRSKLIQIPCHQQLKQSQLDYIVESINQLSP